MKLINQSVELITEQNPLKCIELAGRVSHKSEDRITEDSHKAFIKQMLKLGHTATLEFGSVYLQLDNLEDFCNYYELNFGTIKFNKHPAYFINYTSKRIYTNLRWLLDNCTTLFVDYINNTLKYCYTFIPSNDNPYKRYTFKIICNRGVSHELVRHRVFSFLQESTRYCNYSKDKFSNELNIIEPDFVKNNNKDLAEVYLDTLYNLECKYSEFTNGTYETTLKAQEARGILPNDLKTELYMCGFLKDWVGHKVETYAIDIFGESVDVTTRLGFDTLRRHASAHPQAREIAELVFEDLIKEVGSTEFAKIKETYYE